MESIPVQSDLERATAKAIRRLVPFLLLMYVLAFLDRANIGFAKQAFQLDTGLSESTYALGAGLFFLGYSLFSVPSNLILHRVGARLWMCRIMIAWGLVSATTMWADSPRTFYALRFLLGVAEAGFFPGVIYFLAVWFPAPARTRVLGVFYFGAPVALIVGSPLSGLLLEMNGIFGLKGWQWLFLIEGLLAAAAGWSASWCLANRPTEASWLSSTERNALASALAIENHDKNARGPRTVLDALTNSRVLFLAFIYFLIQMSVYGVVFFLPTQIAALLGVRVGLVVGCVAAIPWVCALVATFFLPRWAERTGRHAGLAALSLLLCGLGLALSVMVQSPTLALAGLCLAAAGFIAVQPLFWSFPTTYLAGAAAAGGIAFINSLGMLGGFVAPNLRHWAEQSFASNRAGVLLLAGTTLLGAALFLALRTGAPSAATTAPSRPWAGPRAP
jgi:MFS family permease